MTDFAWHMYVSFYRPFWTLLLSNFHEYFSNVLTSNFGIPIHRPLVVVWTQNVLKAQTIKMEVLSTMCPVTLFTGIYMAQYMTE